MRKRSSKIGGQAVIEGVMMRGERSIATAVRLEEGGIAVESRYIKPAKDKNVLFRIPIIRGVLNFFGSMVTGIKTLMRSGEVFGDEEGEPSKFEKWLAKTFKVDIYSVVMFISVLLGVALAVGLFVFLPLLCRNGVEALIPQESQGSVGVNIGLNFLEGVIRLIIFILYIFLTSLMKDIRRTYMYHGAEHKTISAYENELPLEVKSVQTMSTYHDRCGTTFMVLVMIIGVLVLSVCDLELICGLADDWAPNRVVKFLADLGWRLLLMLPIMGISYEVLKFLAKFDNAFVRALKFPGKLMQKLTTREPDDSMVEVAIAAFTTVMAMDADPNLPELSFDTNELYTNVRKKLESMVEDKADVDWMICHVTGKKRSELDRLTYIRHSKVELLEEMARRRQAGEPLWQIIGNADFYGYEIDIDRNVLCPRPETEEIVHEALKVINEESSVLDLCTGSGCIAVVVAGKTGARVTASDISEKALDMARRNAQKHKLEDKIVFVKSDMFADIEGKFDVIISNPPYIPSAEIDGLQREVKDFEPRTALDGGDDELNYYRTIAKEASAHLNEGGRIFLEVGIGQAQAVADMLTDFKVTTTKDMQGIERIVCGVKK